MQENKLYIEDLENAIKATNDIEKLRGEVIFITGANGLIGSFIIDIIMYLNKTSSFNTTVIANSRNIAKLNKRFDSYIQSPLFQPYIGDIIQPINYSGHVDYIINCASNTHPLQYATRPIETIITNIDGTSNVLDFATETGAKKTLFLSSVEIYGENIDNIERFKETDMGYIDCNSLRSGYNEAKRCAEALCQAYIEQNGIDVSILRLPRIYGPTVKADDTKVMSQFIFKAMHGEDIILKSNGEQFFSYLYVADAVSGILTCLISGKNGEVYNLGNIDSDIKIKDLARVIAEKVGVKVVFKRPGDIERKGYSKATIARLDYSKITNSLDWKPLYSIEDGIKRTLEILKDTHRGERGNKSEMMK